MRDERDMPAHRGRARGPGGRPIRILMYALLGALVVLPMAARIRGNDDTMRAYAAGAHASLSLPATISGQPNQAIDLPVTLNTDAAVIDAVDVSLTFNPAILALSDITPGAAGTSLRTFVPVNGANAFDVAAIVSRSNGTGKIAFGAATFDSSTQAPTSGYAGTTQLAVLHFTAMQIGTTAVTFNVGSSTSSTVVLESVPPQNLLTQPGQVTNAAIGIGGPPHGRPSVAPVGPANPMPQPRSGGLPSQVVPPSSQPPPRP
jgi:hypothetical protein